MLKYWAQVPAALWFTHSVYYMSPIPGGISLALFLLIRYYSQVRYPQIKRFEAYYVEKLAVSTDFSKVQLTWAMPKQPKVFVVPVEKFKQIHYLNHKIEDKLADDLVPFHVIEQGFDDNKYESLYRTIFLQVQDQQQNEFYRMFAPQEELTEDDLSRKKSLVQMMLRKMGQTFDKSKEHLVHDPEAMTQLKFDARDLVKLQGVQIDPEFVLAQDEQQASA